jgi:hypothetical protein
MGLRFLVKWFVLFGVYPWFDSCLDNGFQVDHFLASISFRDVALASDTVQEVPVSRSISYEKDLPLM